MTDDSKLIEEFISTSKKAVEANPESAILKETARLIEIVGSTKWLFTKEKIKFFRTFFGNRPGDYKVVQVINKAITYYTNNLEPIINLRHFAATGSYSQYHETSKGKVIKVDPDALIEIRGGESFVRVENVEDPEDFYLVQMLPPELDFLRDWAKKEFKLQVNECSRLHRLEEAIMTTEEAFRDAAVFVVKHDWFAAFPDLEANLEDVKLPADICVFEFKISGVYITAEISARSKNKLWLFAGVPTKDGIPLPEDADFSNLYTFVRQQIVAISIMLDSEVAETSEIHPAAGIQKKRLQLNKPPMHSYRIVDLAKKHVNRPRTTNLGEPSYRIRCHFRRGHWRHYANLPRKWINWTLVGDPDLGFVHKHYKL